MEKLRKRSRGRLIGRWAVLAAITYGVWLSVLLGCETRMVYPREMAGPATREALIPREVERVWIDVRDEVRVEGWFVPSGLDRPAPAVMFFHGNGELIDHNLALAEAYRERGVATLLVEYRGYGRSGGSPLQKDIVADSVMFHDWLAKKAGVDPTKIILHGRSLGTGVAAQVAALRPPAALILESPFTSVASFAKQYGAPAFLVRNPYRTDQVLPTLKCPILILHSRQDEIVPFSHGERLHALAPASKLVELNGGHNAALSEQEAYWREIGALLRKLD
jgi:pimeloyl-ACP methyl ester carboxylesterase